MRLNTKVLIRFSITIVVLSFSCKENIAQPKNESERIKSECPKIVHGDFYWGKPCVKENNHSLV